ncbi:isochorismatase family protein [Methylobacterium brachythecii]|uniref:Hydrolase n=1 Tax=Methylobacterium brachythecii TaxID=1176177 RepID=A0A7W6F6F9_9HYPH|nr:isochorismatase family protein [Methylobacterium brachythecii]MBB3901971.1 nicotinamidase-related amidase [Methylobacterium brachythecii]GLS43353.1 hydrolase [Methylobacterium brachythecii]
MALTALDPKTALLVIDLQKGIVGMLSAEQSAGGVANAARLTKAFRRQGLPVVLVNVAGGSPGRVEQRRNLGDLPPDWTEIIPELDRQPGDHLVTKRSWGAFTDTDLDAHLRGRGVTQVVLAGIATSVGVESTARFAHELGYNVTLAHDAMADRSPEAHQYSLTQIFPRIGETGTSAEIVAMLDRGEA